MAGILRLPRGLCVLRHLCVLCVFVGFNLCVLCAHEIEKTQVAIRFERDGAFAIDVTNDPAWLRDRMQSIPGPFADRIVLWVDGREVRPESVELLQSADSAVHRVHGRLPLDARTLRWYYGLVGDPYPLTVRRADGRIIVEEVQGDAWSKSIDVSGQFKADDRWPILIVIALAIAGGVLRLRSALSRRS